MARVSRGSFTTVNSTGSQRASDRISTEKTGSILAVLPIQGYVQLFWAENGFDQSFDRESTGFL
jgi:hypothetical protein